MSAQRTAFFLIPILLVALLTGCAGDEQKKNKHYQRALEYINIEDSKNAILELRNALKIDAKYADAHYQLGLLYLRQDQPRQAFEQLLRAASLDPTNLDANVKVAEFQLLSKNNEESRKLVEHVLSIDPNYLDALSLIANLDHLEGKLDAAEIAVNRAIDLSPETAKFYNIKGRILRDKGQTLPAETAFKRAVELDPDTFANYQSLLMFYEREGNEEATQNILKTTSQRFPDNPQLQLMLARIHEKNNAFDKAEAALQKTITNEENSVSYRLLLANFYTKRNRIAEAEDFLRKSLEIFPENLQLQLALAELLFETRNFEEAKALQEKILAGNPQNGSALLLKARFLIHEGANEQAIETLTPLLNDYPKWADPFYYSALTHLRIGKITLAQKAIQLAIENSPQSDRFHALAAQIYLVQNSSAEAVNEARTALQLNPKNVTAVKILAKSLVQAKENEAAENLIAHLNPDAVQNDGEILESLALAQLGRDKKEEARLTLTRLVAIQPENVKALALLTAIHAPDDVKKAIAFVEQHLKKNKQAGTYILLGELHLKNNDPDKALAAFKNAQGLNPKNPQSYIKSARVLAYQKKLDAALREYEDLLTQYPDSIDGLLGCATTYEAKGDKLKAKEFYQKVLKVRPEHPVASNNLAMILTEEDGGDLGEALRLAMQAKQGMPRQYFVSDTLGWVHYKRGANALAITQFEVALKSSPDNPNVLYHLALARYANGEQQQAMEILNEVLEKNREFAEREKALRTLSDWGGSKN